MSQIRLSTRCTLTSSLRPALLKKNPSRCCRKRCFVTRSVDKKESEAPVDVGKQSKDDKGFSIPSWVITTSGLAVWALFVGYGFFLSPNLTPSRDLYFVQKAINLLPDDGFQLNTIFYAIFYLFGPITFTYASLVIPAGQSKNKIPAWPFLTAMLLLGNYSFLFYTALWKPDPTATAPPFKQDMTGWTNAVLRVTESTLFPLLLFFPVSWLMFLIITSGAEEWNAFFQLYDESRLVHNSTLDICSLVLLLPFWMSNDATAREWTAKERLLTPLSLLPLIGPIVYLILRPKPRE